MNSGCHQAHSGLLTHLPSQVYEFICFPLLLELTDGDWKFGSVVKYLASHKHICPQHRKRRQTQVQLFPASQLPKVSKPSSSTREDSKVLSSSDSHNHMRCQTRAIQKRPCFYFVIGVKLSHFSVQVTLLPRKQKLQNGAFTTLWPLQGPRKTPNSSES